MEFVPPILRREFVVRSRDRSMYNFRLVTASVSFALALGFVVLPSLLGSGVSVNGRSGFVACAWFLWLFCVVEGLRVASDCLSGEKRDGTIGLLFLTRMSGFDVVTGKLSSGLVGSLFALLAALPVLGFLMLGGGVTGGEFCRVCAALVATLVLALALGALISARSFHAGRSLMGSGGILLAWILGSVMAVEGVGMFLPSPWTLLFGAFDAAFQLSPSSYWISLVTVCAIAGACVVTSGFVLRRQRQVADDPETPTKKEGATRLGRWLGLGMKRPLSNSHPISWLADRARWIENEKRVALLVLLVGMPLALFPPLSDGFSTIVSWVLAGGILWEGLKFFMGARSSGCLELILTTPIGVDEILSQLHLHVRRFALNGAGLIFVVNLIGFIGGSVLAISGPAYSVAPGSALIGMNVANGVWSDFLLQFLMKFVELGLGAIAIYFWLYGVYWYSLWRGALGYSISNALGWILFIAIVCFAFYLWIGMILFMFSLMGASRFLSSSPSLVTLFVSGIGSILTVLYFRGLAKHSKRSLRGFLVVSSPLVHGMKVSRFPRLR